MKVVHLDEAIDYDGRQLHTAFFDEHAAREPDALVTFRGAADVPAAGRSADAPKITSPLMAHVLVEHRAMSLREGILAQRLLVRLAADFVQARAGVPVTVRGQAILVGDARLSVSLAIASARGALIHLGVNVDVEGAPDRTIGLRDMRLPAREFLRTLGRLYADEYASVQQAVARARALP